MPGGDNISYTAPAGPVTFYYDHGTHYVTSDAQGPIITAPGSFQSELGCPADWSPDCMRPWLQDPDGDGTYTWSSDQLPAGTYEFKVAHGLSWDENYGAGGAPGGGNISVTVAGRRHGRVDLLRARRPTSRRPRSVKAGAAPDLTKQRAVWVEHATSSRGPPTMVPEGATPALLRWRLAWSATGGLSVDAEDIIGGSSAPLTSTPTGSPRRSQQRIPSSPATSPCGSTRRRPSRCPTSSRARLRSACTTR